MRKMQDNTSQNLFVTFNLGCKNCLPLKTHENMDLTWICPIHKLLITMKKTPKGEKRTL